jgi:dihydropteroate synthase
MNLFGGRSLDFGGTLVMGILNVTRDSFYRESRASGPGDAVSRALRMAGDGADIIDIGAESTRPGSAGVSEEAEMEALIPVVEAVRRELRRMPISADTRKASVARASIDAGADIVNDVSALRLPDEAEGMMETVASSGAAYILTHTAGTPDVMQELARYSDLLPELMEFFESSVARLERAGVERGRIIIDPGLGFGKSASDNLSILANLDVFSKLDLPILIGASRKGFIGTAQGKEALDSPSERLEGTLAVSALSVLGGAGIVRVHDVKANRRAVGVALAVKAARVRAA